MHTVTFIEARIEVRSKSFWEAPVPVLLVYGAGSPCSYSDSFPILALFGGQTVRLSLGLTQAQVGLALQSTDGLAVSQSSICRFEKLEITALQVSSSAIILFNKKYFFFNLAIVLVKMAS